MEKNENQFNNFKIHTQYSICEGAIKIDELADFCKKIILNLQVFVTALIFAEL